jgi:hypothetical protein
MGTSRCPVCRGTFGMTEAVCPHCGHDFPSTPERPDAPWWVYALCLAVALLITLTPARESPIYGVFMGGMWLCVLFGMIRGAWRFLQGD